MPKLVDHNARRRELAEAVWRVVQREGIEHASVRGVAAESGWSAGSVRHYFPNHDALLAFAMDLVLQGFLERACRSPAATDVRTEAIPEAVRQFVVEALPLDEHRTVEAAVSLAFISRARVDPTLVDTQLKASAEMDRWLQFQLGAASEAGLLRQRADPGREACRLRALIDGLAMYHLLIPDTFGHTALLAVVDDHIGELFPSTRP